MTERYVKVDPFKIPASELPELTPESFEEARFAVEKLKKIMGPEVFRPFTEKTLLGVALVEYQLYCHRRYWGLPDFFPVNPSLAIAVVLASPRLKGLKKAQFLRDYWKINDMILAEKAKYECLQ